MECVEIMRIWGRAYAQSGVYRLLRHGIELKEW